jgi:hypothetical protein
MNTQDKLTHPAVHKVVSNIAQLTDQELSHLMDVCECEIVNRMVAQHGLSYVAECAVDPY